jgi:hypothetical protein
LCRRQVDQKQRDSEWEKQFRNSGLLVNRKYLYCTRSTAAARRAGRQKEARATKIVKPHFLPGKGKVQLARPPMNMGLRLAQAAPAGCEPPSCECRLGRHPEEFRTLDEPNP